MTRTDTHRPAPDSPDLPSPAGSRRSCATTFLRRWWCSWLLPLSLGIAIASGAPPLAGLIAAIVGGVVAGALGGSPLQVIAGGRPDRDRRGPDLRVRPVTCAITVGAGAADTVRTEPRRTGGIGDPPMVVHAMLAGIGITIALQQIHVLLGGETHSSAWHNIAALPVHLGQADLPGLAVGTLVIVILIAWRRVPEQLRKVPGPLVAIVVASIAAAVLAPNTP